MHQLTSSGWAITIYAAAVVVLLVVWTFRLDEFLTRRKKAQGPHAVAGKRFQNPSSRLMDPHGGGAARGPAREGRRPRPRVIP